jgi:hypothetical protein
MPNVIDNEDLYNVITLGGTSSPGIVTLSGHNRKVDWDIKDGPGLTGATTTLKSIPPIEFTASFYLVYDVAQGLNELDAWPAFQALIDSTVASKTPVALDIYHPDLASQQPPITSVAKAEVGGMVYDGKGGATVVVKFQEFRPPKAKGGTVAASKAGTTPVDPNADLKAQLAALTNQYANTPWG